MKNLQMIFVDLWFLAYWQKLAVAGQLSNKACPTMLFTFFNFLSTKVVKKRHKRAFFELKIISKHKHVKTAAELPFPFLFVNTSFSRQIAKEDSRQNAAWNQRNQGKNFLQIYFTTLGVFINHMGDEIWLKSPRLMNF